MAPVYAGINGIKKKLKEWPVGIGGVIKQQKEVWAGVDGVKKKIFSLVRNATITFVGAGGPLYSVYAKINVNGTDYYGGSPLVIQAGTFVTFEVTDSSQYGYGEITDNNNIIQGETGTNSTGQKYRRFRRAVNSDMTVELSVTTYSYPFYYYVGRIVIEAGT